MSKSEPTFSQSLKRLEEIVEKLEDPNLDLEDGLSLLEEGVKLHKLCRDKLTQANTKIEKILKDDQASLDKSDSEGEPA